MYGEHTVWTVNSAAASGWAGWALAHPEFGSSVNPGWADYAHHITACPPGFENLAASLLCSKKFLSNLLQLRQGPLEKWMEHSLKL